MSEQHEEHVFDVEIIPTTAEEQAAMDRPQIFEEPTAIIGREVYLVNDTNEDPDSDPAPKEA